MWIDICKSTKDTRQKYWFKIVSSGNNRTLASSEMYANKADAVHAAKLIRSEAAQAGIYDETGELGPGKTAAQKRIW